MNKITAGHADSQSLDVVTENIEKLKALFPTVVKEGKLDVEELKALMGDHLEAGDEFYRFTWAGKAMARQEANKPSTGTLRPNKEESKDWDTTENIFIEGDNLEVLKLLQKSYASKIKMIYIDPPYNTGKDFVYKDNYADNLGNYLALTGQTDDTGRKLGTNSDTDGRYHSNWLNMMYPRLKLARNLMKEEGVIFISIDDKEVYNLRKICDEVFGEENFLGELIWNLKSGTQAGHFTRSNEFVVCYAKHKLSLPYFGDNTGGTIKHGALKKISKVNPASEIEFPVDFEIEGNPDAVFKGELGGSEKQFILSEEMRFKNGRLTKPTIVKAGWAMRNQLESWLDGEETVDSKGQKVVRFFFNAQGILWYEKERGTFHPKTILPEEIGSTKTGSSQLLSLFETKVFDFPKPTSLVKFFIELVTIADKEAIILDFFAGSGTTAEAVLQMNSEDTGNRKFITIQLEEPTKYKNDKGVWIESEGFKAGYKIISDITKERIRRAGEKINAEAKKNLFSDPGNKLDIGFKTFKLDSSNINAWDGSIADFERNLFNSADNIKTGRTEEDVLYEILLKNGLDLTLPITTQTMAGKTVYNIGEGALFICLGNGITTAVAEGIGQWKETLQPITCKVIFKDNGFTDVEKTNSIQILKRYGITEVNSI